MASGQGVGLGMSPTLERDARLQEITTRHDVSQSELFEVLLLWLRPQQWPVTQNVQGALLLVAGTMPQQWQMKRFGCRQSGVLCGCRWH